MFGDTLPDYELFIYSLQDDYPTIRTSTLRIIRQASNVATVEGELFFQDGLRLHILEVVRFDVTPPQITRYGYEAWRGDEKLTGTIPRLIRTIRHWPPPTPITNTSTLTSNTTGFLRQGCRLRAKSTIFDSGGGGIGRVKGQISRDFLIPNIQYTAPQINQTGIA